MKTAENRYTRNRREADIEKREHISFADIHLMSFGDALTGRNYSESVSKQMNRFDKNE